MISEIEFCKQNFTKNSVLEFSDEPTDSHGGQLATDLVDVH